jgi:hypothetical protein
MGKEFGNLWLDKNPNRYLGEKAVEGGINGMDLTCPALYALPHSVSTL